MQTSRVKDYLMMAMCKKAEFHYWLSNYQSDVTCLHLEENLLHAYQGMQHGLIILEKKLQVENKRLLSKNN